MSTNTLPRPAGNLNACRRVWLARLEEIQKQALWLTQACAVAFTGMNEDVHTYGGKLADAKLLEVTAGASVALKGLKRQSSNLDHELWSAMHIMRRSVMRPCFRGPKSVVADKSSNGDKKPKACGCAGNGSLRAVK